MGNSRVLIFVLSMTVSVALLLAMMYTGLKPIHEKNEKIYNKKAILASINAHLGQKASDLPDAEAEKIFTDFMTQVVVDEGGNILDGVSAETIDMAKEEKKPLEQRQWPVYIYDDGKAKFYILSVRGNGLWDKIWGNIALQEDLNTIAGVSFDHQGETPGLGAEIKDNPSYAKQFIGKKLFDANGTYKSVRNVKGGVKNQDHEVDVISGATVTCDGVSEMMNRGIADYDDFISATKEMKPQTKQ